MPPPPPDRPSSVDTTAGLENLEGVLGDCITLSSAQTVEGCEEIGAVKGGAQPFGDEVGAP